jgi:hypothetical protein
MDHCASPAKSSTWSRRHLPKFGATSVCPLRPTVIQTSFPRKTSGQAFGMSRRRPPYSRACFSIKEGGHRWYTSMIPKRFSSEDRRKGHRHKIACLLLFTVLHRFSWRQHRHCSLSTISPVNTTPESALWLTTRNARALLCHSY